MADRIQPPSETSSPNAKYNAKYRVKNWPKYNRALVSRGGVTLWIDAAVIAGWSAEGGKGMRYGNVAILCALSIRAAFKLPLRQTKGFLASLVRPLNLSIEVPPYSTLCRRASGLVVPRVARSSAGGPVHLAIDSSGLKVYGEGFEDGREAMIRSGGTNQVAEGPAGR